MVDCRWCSEPAKYDVRLPEGMACCEDHASQGRLFVLALVGACFGHGDKEEVKTLLDPKEQED